MRYLCGGMGGIAERVAESFYLSTESCHPEAGVYYTLKQASIILKQVFVILSAALAFARRISQ